MKNRLLLGVVGMFLAFAGLASAQVGDPGSASDITPPPSLDGGSDSGSGTSSDLTPPVLDTGSDSGSGTSSDLTPPSSPDVGSGSGSGTSGDLTPPPSLDAGSGSGSGTSSDLTPSTGDQDLVPAAVPEPASLLLLGFGALGLLAHSWRRSVVRN